MPLYVHSELWRIAETLPPGPERVQALTQLGERLVAALTETSDVLERHRLQILHQHVMRRAADEREGGCLISSSRMPVSFGNGPRSVLPERGPQRRGRSWGRPC